MNACPPGAHLHPPRLVVMTGSWMEMAVGDRLIALVPADQREWGLRVCELLERHGLADVPDTPAELYPGPVWPPPDPSTRRTA